MRKRVVFLAVACLFAVVGTVVWRVAHIPEPYHQGKSLTEWLIRCAKEHNMLLDYPRHLEAENAIRAIGTNAFPTLLRMMARRDSRLKKRLVEALPHRFSRFFHIGQGYHSRILAAYGYMALRESGKPLVPALVEMTTNTDPNVRYTAVFALAHNDFTASDAKGALVICLRDSDFRVKDDAVLCVGRNRFEPETVVPLLVNWITDPRQDSVLQLDAIKALGFYGPTAEKAVPTLLRLLNDEDDFIRDAVSNALPEIDPQAMTRTRSEAQ